MTLKKSTTANKPSGSLTPGNTNLSNSKLPYYIVVCGIIVVSILLVVLLG